MEKGGEEMQGLHSDGELDELVTVMHFAHVSDPLFTQALRCLLRAHWLCVSHMGKTLIDACRLL